MTRFVGPMGPRARASLLLAVALACVSGAEAQTSGAMLTRATVLPAIATIGSALAFGNTTPTAVKTVAATAGGTFRITGTPGVLVNVSFTFPTTLGHPLVAVGAWTGAQNSSPSAATSTPFTPSASPQSLPLNASNGRVYLWIGGTLTTSAAPAGTFSAPIVMTVVYN